MGTGPISQTMLDYAQSRKGEGLPSFGVCRMCLSGHYIPDKTAEIKRPRKVQANNGPGTELKKLLAKLGITQGGCSCNSHAAEMDRKGPDWCTANLDTITGWLRDEAAKRKLPFSAVAARLLIRRAIKVSMTHNLTPG